MSNIKNSAKNYAIHLIGLLDLIEDEDFVDTITNAVMYKEEYLLEEMQKNLQSEATDDTDADVALDMIDEAPTVEERKHGRWKEDEDKDIYCTNCKHFLYPAEIRMQQITLSSRRLKRKFCPECGAIIENFEVNEND